MARVPASAIPPAPRKPWHRRVRVSAPTIRASRLMAVVLLAIVIAWGPDPWLRAVSAAASVVVVYLAGWADGRRDLAFELLRRDGGGTGQPSPRGQGTTESGPS